MIFLLLLLGPTRTSMWTAIKKNVFKTVCENVVQMPGLWKSYYSQFVHSAEEIVTEKLACINGKVLTSMKINTHVKSYFQKIG